ncbi:MAG: AmmeMemoRadiSam system radical SAM enzyme [Armatimonadota bacterium]|nr:MAG: AmmeMemoRadiSam system radical SAM enzyme [Armatimonadota bacterium]
MSVRFDGLDAGITRRQFMRGCALSAVGACALAAGCDTAPAVAARKDEWYLRRALYYKRLPKLRVRCELCPRECVVGDRERGYCGVRENRGGDYYTVVYGRACTVQVDPIEKKPLFHYLPGRPIYSFSTAGCNLECKNCQNWQISQSRPEQVREIRLTPAEMIAQARRRGVSLIAGTYAEPVVFYEYMEDVAKEGKKRGVRSVAITAGYINPQPMRRLCQSLDAIKIDLKSMREEFYRKNCSGRLRPVLDAIIAAKRTGTWLEIVYLVIPTMNDSDAEIKDLAQWMKSELGPDVPLHFSRFHPTYRMTNLPPTPAETLTRCRDLSIAAGLRYVYVGNLPGHPGESTYCPKCKRVVIERQVFYIKQNNLRDGKCKSCGASIPGVWS